MRLRRQSSQALPVTLACLGTWLGGLGARAEADTFLFGDGHHGALVVSSPGTVVNTYTTLTSAAQAGALSLSVNSTAGLSAGDLVMLWQSTGTVVEDPDAGLTDPVDLGSTGVGRYELARLVNIGSGLGLDQALVSSFPAGETQVVRVPEYSQVTVADGGTVVAKRWDGATGGIVALLASEGVLLNGSISAFRAGFRGGISPGLSGVTGTCTELDEDMPRGSPRGEGVVTSWWGSSGRRGLPGGGGGGGCTYGGGAGGGHVGRGGVGGNNPTSVVNGGLGGRALSYSPLDRLMMGGGAGVGWVVPLYAPYATAGAGGGVVWIRAPWVLGGGTLRADGEAGQDFGGGDWGYPGGGAGGFISVRVAQTLVCGSLSAQGGRGGNGANIKAPGGGGGGGAVLVQASTSACPADVRAGAAGLTSGGLLRGAGPASTSGPEHVGQVMILSSGLSAPPVPTLTQPLHFETLLTQRPTVAGAAPAGSDVLLYVDGVLAASGRADGTGSFSFAPPSPLALGLRRLEVSARVGGLESGRSPAVVVYLVMPPVDAGVGDGSGGTLDGGDTTAPRFLSTPSSSVFCGTPYRYSAQRVPQVAGGGPLHFELAAAQGQLPAGLTVDAATGELFWRPSAAQAGPHELVLTVASAWGTDSQRFTVLVDCEAPRELGVSCASTPGVIGGGGLLAIAAGCLRRRRRASVASVKG